jgi:hypothetical protein
MVCVLCIVVCASVAVPCGVRCSTAAAQLGLGVLIPSTIRLTLARVDQDLKYRMWPFL